jgi:hypothetical protein
MSENLNFFSCPKVRRMMILPLTEKKDRKDVDLVTNHSKTEQTRHATVEREWYKGMEISAIPTLTRTSFVDGCSTALDLI